MRCTKCNYDHTSVVETRLHENNSKQRRRQCDRCGFRFTTLENPKEYKYAKTLEKGDKSAISKF